MKTSERALAAMQPKEMPERDRPISEEFRLIAKKWVEADGAASLMEELKSTTMEQMKAKLAATRGAATPDNRLTMMVKASDDWVQYIRQMCELRLEANRLKVQLEFIRMRYGEWQAADATARAEMRLR